MAPLWNSSHDTYLEKVDLSKDAFKYLDENQRFILKKVEKASIRRSALAKKSQSKGRLFGFGLCFMVAGIYFGTIFKIKQEEFLD